MSCKSIALDVEPSFWDFSYWSPPYPNPHQLRLNSISRQNDFLQFKRIFSRANLISLWYFQPASLTRPIIREATKRRAIAFQQIDFPPKIIPSKFIFSFFKLCWMNHSNAAQIHIGNRQKHQFCNLQSFQYQDDSNDIYSIFDTRYYTIHQTNLPIPVLFFAMPPITIWCQFIQRCSAWLLYFCP